MTIVGKILVFMCLVFSLIDGALVLLVYSARTNLETGYENEVAQHKAVRADRDQKEAELKAAKQEYETKLAILTRDRDDALVALAADKAELKTKSEELASIKAEERKKAADNAALLAAGEARKIQIVELEAANQDLRNQKIELIQQKNEERKGRIQADVEARTYKTRNLDLEEQMRNMARELIRARSGPSGSFVVRKRGDENPPPDNVEGRIKEVDPEDGLVKLTIGSDAGLAQGHTLKVFRLDPIPEKSRYLGTIEILMVRPHEAVGRPTSRIPVAIRPGDRVASRLVVGGN